MKDDLNRFKVQLDSVNLNITSSEQSYLTPRSIEFYKKNTQSRLK